MGNAPSSDEEAQCVGYRLLGVQPNSPAAQAQLVSFFDFIVGANGVPLKQMDNTLMEIIKSSENKPLPLTVYNYKSQMLRQVVITPARRPYYEGMLGVTIRFDTYFNAEENLVRVLSVVKNGPAHIAGLSPQTDYLLGTAERVFKDTDALHEELMRHLEQTMEIYVYSTQTDEVRVVLVLPTFTWGGEGCLGAEIAHGYLHRLPADSMGTTGKSIGPGISMPAPPATPAASTGVSPPQSAYNLQPALAGSGGGGVAPASALDFQAGAAADDVVGGKHVVETVGGGASPVPPPPPPPPPHGANGAEGGGAAGGLQRQSPPPALDRGALGYEGGQQHAGEYGAAGGVIDVDLSGTATQAVTPHLRPRE